MNKTGTTSIHEAFQILGIKSLHWSPEHSDMNWRMETAKVIKKRLVGLIESQSDNPLKDWDEYSAYSDINPIINRFEYFYNKYPGSKFIYTCRDDDGWLRSREKHVQRNIKARGKGRYESDFLTIDREGWLKEKHEHFRRVKKWFSEIGKESEILYFDIFRGDGFPRLCEFLGLPIPPQDFPWENAEKLKEGQSCLNGINKANTP